MRIQITKIETLFEAAAALSPESSKTTLKQWIREGRILVDGHPIRKGELLVYPGQTVGLGPKPRRAETLSILYEDTHLVAVDKPSSLLSVAAAYNEEETAHAILKRRYKGKKIYVVHRLDQHTSGVMLFALSEEGYQGLKKLFASHDLERIYYALVEGHSLPQQGTWTSYLYEDVNYVVHSTQDSSRGEKAITHFEKEQEGKGYTLLKLTLETGKKNQIRVHCQEAHHPVAGDTKYGAQTNPLNRLALHATHLNFVHPITGRPLRFHSPLPPPFLNIISPSNLNI